MNTPAHVLVNLALLGRGARWRWSRWIVAGALVPDAPFIGFYAWQRLVRGTSEYAIWSVSYFDPAWQRVFDVAHSIPLAAALLVTSVAARTGGGVALAASMLLHDALDLPLHHDDAHRHFLPLSDWRFVSPVSYWDPAYHGTVAALGELVAVLIAIVVVWRRGVSATARAAMLAIALLYVVAYVALYVARAA